MIDLGSDDPGSGYGSMGQHEPPRASHVSARSGTGCSLYLIVSYSYDV